MRNRSLIATLTVFASVQLFSSCATAPPPRKPTVTERIEFDRAIGSELAEQMTPQLSFKKDPQIQAYLSKIAQRLATKNPELHLSEVKVYLLKDADRRYRSYGLPGGRIYLSSAGLKTAEYESEVAAMIAIELGHLLNEQIQNYLRKNPSGLQVQDAPVQPDALPLKTLQAPEDIDFFSKDGMFAFSAKDNDDAIASAVNILYDAGYDPRGLITYLKRLDDNPSHSPWDQAELARITEQARKNVALLTPLRNPIVQTDDFELIRGKIQKL